MVLKVNRQVGQSVTFLDRWTVKVSGQKTGPVDYAGWKMDGKGSMKKTKGQPVMKWWWSVRGLCRVPRWGTICRLRQGFRGYGVDGGSQCSALCLGAMGGGRVWRETD